MLVAVLRGEGVAEIFGPLADRGVPNGPLCEVVKVLDEKSLHLRLACFLYPHLPAWPAMKPGRVFLCLLADKTTEVYGPFSDAFSAEKAAARSSSQWCVAELKNLDEMPCDEPQEKTSDQLAKLQAARVLRILDQRKKRKPKLSEWD